MLIYALKNQRNPIAGGLTGRQGAARPLPARKPAGKVSVSLMHFYHAIKLFANVDFFGTWFGTGGEGTAASRGRGACRAGQQRSRTEPGGFSSAGQVGSGAGRSRAGSRRPGRCSGGNSCRSGWGCPLQSGSGADHQRGTKPVTAETSRQRAGAGLPFQLGAGRGRRLGFLSHRQRAGAFPRQIGRGSAGVLGVRCRGPGRESVRVPGVRCRAGSLRQRNRQTGTGRERETRPDTGAGNLPQGVRAGRTACSRFPSGGERVRPGAFRDSAGSLPEQHPGRDSGPGQDFLFSWERAGVVGGLPFSPPAGRSVSPSDRERVGRGAGRPVP